MKLFKGDLNETWSRTIVEIDSPSVRAVARASKCRLRAIHKDGQLFWKSYRVEIEVTVKWNGMIQSRKEVIKEAFQKVLSSKKVKIFIIAV
jgi:hypothetical protein